MYSLISITICEVEANRFWHRFDHKPGFKTDNLIKHRFDLDLLGLIKYAFFSNE